jgi:hypothetical protein
MNEENNLVKKIIKEEVKKSKLLESKLSDYGKNTPAALEKEKEIKNKKIDKYDSLKDLDLNTLNRNKTIKEYRYGPLNPNDKKGSKQFWEDKAKMWDTSVEHAKTSKCKNCVAFNQKTEILNKIVNDIGKEGDKIVNKANLGFCEFFWFKCAGERTCDAWVGGGPIKK